MDKELSKAFSIMIKLSKESLDWIELYINRYEKIAKTNEAEKIVLDIYKKKKELFQARINYYKDTRSRVIS